MSHEVINQFYGSFPFRGVRFDKQINPWKDNTKATNPLVQAGFVAPNSANRTQDILAYLASGKVGKRYTFRSGYDSHNSQYKIQYNTGTDGSQVWVDYLTIDEASGHITAVHGISGGFYGLKVTETSGVPKFSTDKIIFNSEHFYLTNNSQGKPIINFVGSSGEANTASNVGAGTGLFAQKSGVDLQFKSLLAGSNIVITQDSDEVTIASQAAGGFYGINVGLDDGSRLFRQLNTVKFDNVDFYISQNSPNTDEVIISFRPDEVQNVGSGAGVFKQKSNKTFQLKSITAGSNITLTENTNDIQIASVGGGGGFYGVLFKESEAGGYSKRSDALVVDSAFFYLSTDGDGRPLLSLVNANGTVSRTFSSSTQWILSHNLGTKELFWGAYDSADEAVIPYKVDVSDPNTTYFYFSQAEAGFAIVSRGGGGSGGAGTAENVGAGVGLFAQKSGDTLQFKSLVAGQNISITQDSDEVTITGVADKFYGISITNSPVTESYKNVNTIKFDSVYFYLDQNLPNTDEVLISFKPVAISNIAGPGFYGVVFKETEAGGAKFKKDALSFDSRYFYLSSGGDGKPVVSATRSSVELLARLLPNNAASVDILSNILNSTLYRTFIIKFRLTPSVDDVELWVRTSTDNGVSFDAGASDYSYSGMANLSGTAAVLSDASDDAIAICGNASGNRSIGNAANEHAAGTITIEHLGDASKFPFITYHTTWIDATAVHASCAGGGTRRSAAAVNAIRLLMESGALSGVVEVYGVPIV